MNTRNISFSEKKVSKNAVITLVMGIIILISFVILTILSVVTGGGLNVIGGLMSYDDAKTSQKYKISGICINIVAIFIGITFIMM